MTNYKISDLEIVLLFTLPSIFITMGATLMSGGAALEQKITDYTARNLLSIDKGKLNIISAVGIAIYLVSWGIFATRLRTVFQGKWFEPIIYVSSFTIPLFTLILYLDAVIDPGLGNTLWWVALIFYIISWGLLGIVFINIFTGDLLAISILIPILVVAGSIMMIPRDNVWCFYVQLGQIMYFYAWGIFIFMIAFYQENQVDFSDTKAPILGILP